MTPTEERTPAEHPASDDPGLRQILTWTAIALIVALLMAAVAVTLVTRWFGSAP